MGPPSIKCSALNSASKESKTSARGGKNHFVVGLPFPALDLGGLRECKSKSHGRLTRHGYACTRGRYRRDITSVVLAARSPGADLNDLRFSRDSTRVGLGEMTGLVNQPRRFQGAEGLCIVYSITISMME